MTSAEVLAEVAACFTDDLQSTYHPRLSPLIGVEGLSGAAVSLNAGDGIQHVYQAGPVVAHA